MRETKATVIIASIMLCILLMLIASSATSAEKAETADQTIRTPSGKTLTVVPIDPDLPQPTMTAMRAGTTVVLEENFDNLPNEGVMPDGWRIHDEDGDGSSWEVCAFYGYEGNCSACSPHWSAGPVDNWYFIEGEADEFIEWDEWLGSPYF